jgi:hypothetical protein
LRSAHANVQIASAADERPSGDAVDDEDILASFVEAFSGVFVEIEPGRKSGACPISVDERVSDHVLWVIGAEVQEDQVGQEYIDVRSIEGLHEVDLHVGMIELNTSDLGIADYGIDESVGIIQSIVKVRHVKCPHLFVSISLPT